MSEIYVPTNGTAHGGGGSGQDGFSPIIVEKTSTDSSYILNITDKYHSFDTPNLKGAKGADGTVSFDELTPAQQASLKGEKGDKGDKGDQGDIGPTGIQGPQGNPGTNGFSPTVVVKTSTSSDYVLTITDVNGSYDTPNLKGSGGGGTGVDGTTFYPSVSAEGVISWTNDGGKTNPNPVNIKGPQGETGATGPQGPAGANGTNGTDGYTPVRGTDYWTAADQAAIVQDVLAALPAAESVSA